MTDLMMCTATRLKMIMLLLQACVCLKPYYLRIIRLKTQDMEILFLNMILLEHFLYDRSQGHQMSAFIQSDIPEEEEVSEPVIIAKKYIFIKTKTSISYIFF